MKNTLITLLIIGSLSGCKLSDLRTDYLLENGITESSEEKGGRILEEVYRNQGFDKLETFQTYSVVGSDHWKGLLGKTGNPWPVNEDKIKIRYITNTFDSQLEVLEGKKKGLIAGLQSWSYYEGTEEKLEFQKPDKGTRFVLAAYQYFFELSSRLRNAPIIAYAGEEEAFGESYDKVFATWEDAEPNKNFDQYLLWINKETKLIDFVSYTLRENFLPGPKGIYGTLEYRDYQEVDGLKIPFNHTVRIQDKKEGKGYLHRMIVEEFEFDSFPKEQLYINPELEQIGDEKPYLSAE